ncbi:NADP-dependent oxidoreductase [Nocardia nova]|uniref:NADP-dependent oxidoreductase n=1 Tax=Nocardia nova TaxID=37330 RepID=UPI001FEC6033
MTSRNSMRAVVVRRVGGPEALEVVRVAIPEPGPRQVRIRVEAAAVNPVDIATRSGALIEAGLMAPREVIGIGWDAAGIVDRVGPEVTTFAVGQRVVGLRDLLDRSLGAYAEYLVLDTDAVAPAPPGVDATEAATLPLNALTAHQALALLDLRAGDTLLVTGAAGAVGGFAVELGVRAGLRVVAQVADEDVAFVRGLGAEWTVPRASADVAGEIRALVPGGVDGALDGAGLGVRAAAAVRNGGAYAGVSGGQPPLPLRGMRIHQEWIRADGTTLAELAALGLGLRVADVLPLDRAAEAHERLSAGGLRGRLVLTP